MIWDSTNLPQKTPEYQAFFVESEGFEPTSRQEPTATSTCLSGLKAPAAYRVFPGDNLQLTRNGLEICPAMMPRNQTQDRQSGRTMAALISD